MTRLVVSAAAPARLSVAAEWLREFSADAEVLIVAPTWAAADEIARSAIGTARFGLLRLTLDRLAARLATPLLAVRRRTPASGLSLTAIVARAVHLLLEEGRLDHFRPVATRPGFARALAGTLEELRMNRVPRERLARLVRAGSDLAELAERVERELELVGAADRALVYEAAIEATAKREAPVGLPLLAIDPALTTVLETDLVCELASAAPAVFATAPAGDPRATEALERALGATAEPIRETASTSLAAVREHLFSDSAPPSRALDTTVNLRSDPGEARECVEIARAILREADRGVAFDRMAIFLRSTAEYRSHLEEALRRANVPTYFAQGTTRPDPGGRALLALLACAREGLSARRFAEYLSLAQVPDSPTVAKEAWEPPEHDLLPATIAERPAGGEGDALVEDPEAAAVVGGTLRAPWRWERLLADAYVIGGKDRWARRLGGLEEELRLRRSALRDEDDGRGKRIDRQLRDLECLRGFALPLVDRLAALPARASWSEWLEQLRELAAASLREAATVLATFGELDPMGPVGPIDLDEVVLVLGPKLRDLTAPPPRRRYGAVFVAPAEAARGLEFDVVFVPGLAERLFPRKIAEDPILLDVDRRALDVPELTLQTDRVTTERLALRLAIGAARERLHLSYPRVDVERARPRVASFYALEALRAAEGSLPGFGELGERALAASLARLGWPAPVRPEDAIDEAEYDLSVLSGLMGADEATNAGAARYLLDSNPHLARALRARARRWLRRWTPADGLVDPSDDARAALARHQLTARSFSPTALQNFAICPYRFFLQAIHRLEPREEPLAIEVLDPLTRGALFHEAQFEVFTRLEAGGALPVDASNLASAIEVADTALDLVAAKFEERLAPAIPRVWEDGIQALRADLREWLRRAARDADLGWVPYRFELSFGIGDRDRAQADPTSVPDPVPVAGGLLLRGAIDLVERDSRRGVLRATDHKTGKARAKKDVVVGGGQVLQPVLYGLACELLLDDPVAAGRLYYCTADGDYEERVVPIDERSRAAAVTVVEIVGRALAEGFLPAAPDADACEWCDYRAVCGPYEKIRTARKPAERLTDLLRLRELP